MTAPSRKLAKDGTYRGRPPLPTQQRRDTEIRVYLTQEEKAVIAEKARRAAMREGEYLRDRGLGYQPRDMAPVLPVDPHYLSALNQLWWNLSAIGNNLNQAVRDGHAESARHHDWHALYHEVRDAVRQAKTFLEQAALNDVR